MYFLIQTYSCRIRLPKYHTFLPYQSIDLIIHFGLEYINLLNASIYS